MWEGESTVVYTEWINTHGASFINELLINHQVIYNKTLAGTPTVLIYQAISMDTSCIPTQSHFMYALAH